MVGVSAAAEYAPILVVLGEVCAATASEINIKHIDVFYGDLIRIFLLQVISPLQQATILVLPGCRDAGCAGSRDGG